MVEEHGNSADNPRASSAASSDDATNPQLRWSWRRLVVAYCVHHLTSFVGLMCVHIYFREWKRITTPSKWLDYAVGIPLHDAFVVNDALTELPDGWPKRPELQLLPGVIVLAIAAACVAYARRRSLSLLWFIGVASMLLYFSFVIYRRLTT